MVADVMVSLYHQFLFRNEFQNAPLVDLMRSRMPFNDYTDVRENLLDFMVEVHRSPFSPRFTWAEFVDSWMDEESIYLSTYEALRADTAGEVRRLFQALTGSEIELERAEEISSNFSMAKMKERGAELKGGVRQDGAEVSFIRKGAVGGWSEFFYR